MKEVSDKFNKEIGKSSRMKELMTKLSTRAKDYIERGHSYDKYSRD